MSTCERRVHLPDVTGLRAIAAALNERAIRTPRGVGEWQATQVARVLARLEM
jgi:hypothetical protein